MAHGATTHRDDQEWREHSVAGEDGHLLHLDEHLELFNPVYAHTKVTPIDPDSGQSQLVHVATRALMALEVHLGGGVVK